MFLKDPDFFKFIKDESFISLSDVRLIKLMNRIDTKYVACSDKLVDLLKAALDNGYLVQCNRNPFCRYETLYYDTLDYSMYLMHHNERMNRLKIRTRKYLDTNQTFLEIKSKNNKGRTDKIRMGMILDDKSGYCSRFISENTPFDFEHLYPSVKTDFHRITMVDPDKTERITIDFDLIITNLRTEKYINPERLLIIELKQNKLNNSVFKRILKDMYIHSFKISKYCLGVATTESIKSNRFKSKIHYINKLISSNI